MAAERQVFDTVRYKQTTREQWETAAAAWHRWSSLLSAWLGPATEVMLDMAEIAPGSRVLDVAAGAGEQTGAVARRIGPHGYILAEEPLTEGGNYETHGFGVRHAARDVTLAGL